MKVSKNSAFERYSQHTINKTIRVLLKKDCARLKEYYSIVGKPNYKLLLNQWIYTRSQN